MSAPIANREPSGDQTSGFAWLARIGTFFGALMSAGDSHSCHFSPARDHQ